MSTTVRCPELDVVVLQYDHSTGVCENQHKTSLLSDTCVCSARFGDLRQCRPDRGRASGRNIPLKTIAGSEQGGEATLSSPESSPPLHRSRLTVGEGDAVRWSRQGVCGAPLDAPHTPMMVLASLTQQELELWGNELRCKAITDCHRRPASGVG